jgi:hypothetical protein
MTPIGYAHNARVAREESEEVSRLPVVARGYAPEVLEPVEAPLDHVPALVERLAVRARPLVVGSLAV